MIDPLLSSGISAPVDFFNHLQVHIAKSAKRLQINGTLVKDGTDRVNAAIRQARIGDLGVTFTDQAR